MRISSQQICSRLGGVACAVISGRRWNEVRRREGGTGAPGRGGSPCNGLWGGCVACERVLP